MSLSPPDHKQPICEPTHIKVPRELSEPDNDALSQWLWDFAEGHKSCDAVWERITEHFEAKEVSE